MILAMLGVATITVSQEKKTSIETNPIFLLAGAANVGIEVAVSEKQSIQLSPFFIARKTNYSEQSGFGFTGDYRFYSNEALDGFYFAPLLTYGNFDSKDSYSDTESNWFAVGAKIGWNWLLGKNDNFVIDLGLGAAQYNINSESSESSYVFFTSEPEFKGLGPVINFSIGHAF